MPTLPDGRLVANPQAGTNITNPLGTLSRNGYYINQNNAIESTLSLNYNLDKLLRGLSFRTQYAYDAYFTSQRRQVTGGFATYVVNKETGDITLNGTSQDNPLGAVTGSYGGNISDNLQTSLNFTREIGKHTVSALALFQRQSNRVSGAQAMYASQGLIGDG